MNTNSIDIDSAINSYKKRILHFFKISVLPQLFDSSGVFQNTEVSVSRASKETKTKVIRVIEKNLGVGENMWARCNHPSENIYLAKEFHNTPSLFALLKPFFEREPESKNSVLKCLMPGVLHDEENVDNVYSPRYMQEVSEKHKLTELRLNFGNKEIDEYLVNSCSQIVCVFCVSLLESFLKQLFHSSSGREYFQNVDDLKKLGEYLKIDDIFDDASDYFNSVDFKTKNNLLLKKQFKMIFDYRHATIHENKSIMCPIQATDIILIFYFFAEYISKKFIVASA